MKKKRMIMLCIILTIMLAACGNSSISLGNPVGSFKKQVENNQYLDAVETYRSTIEGNAAHEVEARDYLISYAENAWEDYKAEKIDKAKFEVILQTLDKLDAKISVMGWTLKEIQADYPPVAASKEAYLEGLAQMEKGEYEQALDSFSEVSSADDKNYAAAQEKYEETKHAYIQEIVDSAHQLLGSQDYNGAWSIISTAEWTVGMQDTFETVKAEIATAEFEAGMTNAGTTNDFSTMKTLYASGLDNGYVTISAAMSKLYSETEEGFRQGIIDRSIEAYKNSGYEAAIPVISEGLAVLPEDEKLIKYDELYKSCVPVSFKDLIMLENNDHVGFGTGISDLYGNQYESDFVELVSFNGYTKYGDFYLDGNYSRLTAVCIPNKKMNTSYTISITIYADGVKIYSSDPMDFRTEAQPIDLDISNVRVLRLEAYSEDDGGYLSGPFIYLANASVTRMLTDAQLQNP